ncbi:MAG: glycosyltransferase family 2 protein [bacterium]|nr:glycosyltransferase family 2 protein [bacterium]
MIKVVYIATHLISSFRKYKKTMSINWHKKTSQLDKYEDIYHLVMIPNSSESIEVVETTFNSLIQSTFPKERMIIAFAAEERHPISIENAEIMKEKYANIFHSFNISIHPDGIAGEVAGKGANLTWAGKKVKENIIDKYKIPYENIIVSVFDIDTCVDTSYFDYLTHTYLNHLNPTRSSYQPIPMFNNNIWDAPAIMRVAATGTTFWLMAEQVRPERLFTFSSHSMPFKAVIDVGWWQTDIVSDDSRIFLQCFLHYSGNYQVTPLHMPVYMDTVLSDTWWKSLKNLYKQQRRWAWGSENIPYMLWNFKGRKDISLAKRMYHIFNQMEGMWSWGTASLIVFFGGYLPLWLIDSGQQTTVIAQNAPFVLQYMLTIANVGLILSVILGTTILPPRPSHHRPRKYAMMIIQWVFLPVSMIVFGAIPAIESQTRLMLGKYLGFYVTEKTRKKT